MFGRSKARTPALEERWAAAGEVWSDDLRLRQPELVTTGRDAKRHEVERVLACYSSLTFRTVLNLYEMRRRGVEDYLDTFMAHEIGHHAIAPAGFSNQLRLLAAASEASYPAVAANYVNMALDLLINDILVREHGLPCPEIYRALTGKKPIGDGQYAVMLATMERLWDCGRLYVPNPLFEERVSELADALTAVYLLHGEGRRGGALIPFVALAAFIFSKVAQAIAGDGMGVAWDKSGLGGSDEDEALRRWLRGGGLQVVDEATRQAQRALGEFPQSKLGPALPAWRPAVYGPQLIAGIGTGKGFGVDPSEIAIAQYETMAAPHLIRFEAKTGAKPQEHPESLRTWHLGESLEDVSWIETAIRSGQPIPGVNTVAWEYGGEGDPRGGEPFPMDLDIYIDSSGSMPDPLRALSHITLGAFIFALSAMRQGGAVRATVWSMDMAELKTTGGYSTERDEVLRVLCSSIGGGTQFPVKHWERAPTAKGRRPNLVHTVILSDDGICTWFHGSYKINRVEAHLERVQRELRGGGSVLLNGRAESVRHELPPDWTVVACPTWQEVVAACARIAARRFDA